MVWEVLFLAGLYLRHKFGLGVSVKELHHRIFQRIFKGRALGEFERCLPAYLSEVCESLYFKPACLRLKEAQQAGHHTVIISSSTAFVVAPHAKRLGIQEYYTTEYAEDEHGSLTHLIRLIEGTDKGRILGEVAQRLGVSRERTYAYSDSHLDLPFLEAAGTAVGVNPDRSLRQICLSRGWEILEK